MKYIRQVSIIIAVTLAGEILHNLLPVPLPTSIYGLVLMLILLLCHVIKLEQVEESADFLITIMPIMFIPSAAGLLNSWTQLSEFIIAFIVIVIFSTWIVMAVSGKITQFILTRREKRQ